MGCQVDVGSSSKFVSGLPFQIKDPAAHEKTLPNQEALDAMIREAFLIAPRRRHLLQTYALEPAEGLRRQLVQETNRLGLRANLGKDFGRFSHSNHAPTKGANGKKRMLCITFI